MGFIFGLGLGVGFTQEKRDWILEQIVVVLYKVQIKFILIFAHFYCNFF